MDLFVFFASILGVTILFARQRSALDRIVRARAKARASRRPTRFPPQR